MKKIMILAMLMVMTITANAMSYMEAKKEALYLSDKMAWELSLTNAQYDAVYEINLGLHDECQWTQRRVRSLVEAPQY